MAVQLIIGLGNPGDHYARTRHNVGCWYIDRLATHVDCTLKPMAAVKARVAKCHCDGVVARLAQSTTYMNESGYSVMALSRYFKVHHTAILVAHDELDLPAGMVKLKYDGGHGGHNGLRDIIAALGTKQFYRLRIGIGHPGCRNQVSNYVLHPPNRSDELAIVNAIGNAVRNTQAVVTSTNMQNVMTLFNSQ